MGGSFNPAHAGHLHVALACRRRLGLNAVWLVVSPGNPLKDPASLAPYEERLASARRIADGRQVVATDLERAWGIRYSVDLVQAARQRFPRACFVFLMGADAFAGLHRWKRWRTLIRLVPIAVHARPGADRAALCCQAAVVLRRRRVRSPRLLTQTAPPAWSFLPLAHHAASATALRAAGLALHTGAAGN